MHSLVDFHMHSTASDGKDSPLELLKKIKRYGIKRFSLTDHDTIAGAREMERMIDEEPGIDIQFIRGIEFSCRTNAGKCHILGYRYDWDSEAFKSILERGALLRSQKLEQRISFLRDNYGINFSSQDLETMRSMGSVGKPHMGELMVKMGAAESIGEAIKGYIDKCPTLNSRLPANEAIHAIRAAGGISVWAHPYGGVGETRLDEEAFQEQLKCLLDAGLQGVECHYSRYTAEEVNRLVQCANEHGLCISGGSDYHGREKYPDIGILNAEGTRLDEAEITIYR